MNKSTKILAILPNLDILRWIIFSHSPNWISIRHKHIILNFVIFNLPCDNLKFLPSSPNKSLLLEQMEVSVGSWRCLYLLFVVCCYVEIIHNIVCLHVQYYRRSDPLPPPHTSNIQINSFLTYLSFNHCFKIKVVCSSHERFARSCLAKLGMKLSVSFFIWIKF